MSGPSYASSSQQRPYTYEVPESPEIPESPPQSPWVPPRIRTPEPFPEPGEWCFTTGDVQYSRTRDAFRDDEYTPLDFKFDTGAHVIGFGTVCLTVRNTQRENGGTCRLQIKNVYHMPNMTFNAIFDPIAQNNPLLDNPRYSWLRAELAKTKKAPFNFHPCRRDADNLKAFIRAARQFRQEPREERCYDWLAGENFSYACDRDSFCEYTRLSPHIIMRSPQGVRVVGMGTVSLDVMMRPDSRETARLVLTNVLHIPGAGGNRFNMFALSDRNDIITGDDGNGLFIQGRVRGFQDQYWYARRQPGMEHQLVLADRRPYSTLQPQGFSYSRNVFMPSAGVQMLFRGLAQESLNEERAHENSEVEDVSSSSEDDEEEESAESPMEESVEEGATTSPLEDDDDEDMSSSDLDDDHFRPRSDDRRGPYDRDGRSLEL